MRVGEQGGSDDATVQHKQARILEIPFDYTPMHNAPRAGCGLESPARAGTTSLFQRMGMSVSLTAVSRGFACSIDKRFALSESRIQLQVEARAHSTGGMPDGQGRRRKCVVAISRLHLREQRFRASRTTEYRKLSQQLPSWRDSLRSRQHILMAQLFDAQSRSREK